MAKTSFYSGTTPAALNAGLGLYVGAFKGRTGEVVPALGDYSAALVSNTPAGGLEAETVQGALYELDADVTSLGETVSDLAAELEALPPSGVQSVAAGTGISVNSTVPATPTVALSSSVLTSLGKADSALQSSAIGVTVASKAQGDLANTALQPAAIGTSVQGYDGDLQTIGALVASNDDIIQRKAGAWTNRTVAQVRTDINADQPYGPFGTVYTGSDLNSIAVNGRFMGHSMPNAPDAGWWVVDHMVQGNSPATHGTQTAYSLAAGTSPTKVVVRNKAAGAWGPWRRFGVLDDYVPTFTTKAEAQLYNPNAEPSAAIRILSRTGLAPNNGGQEWLGRKVASVPSHENYVTTAAGTIYERVPAAPASSASVAELGMLPGTGADMAPFLNKVLTASKNSGFSRWYAPPGGYSFDTRPNDVDFEGFILQGEQKARTTFYKNFRSSGYQDATLNLRRGYFQITDIEFISLIGSQNQTNPANYVGPGAQLSVVCPNASTPIGYCTLERLNFTSDATAKASSGAAPGTGATVDRQIVFAGQAADGSTGAAIGIRQIFMNQVQLFGAETASISFINASGVQWMGGAATRAGGKTGRIIFHSVLPSPVQNCNLTLGAVNDGIGFLNARSCMVSAGAFEAGSINFDAASSNNFVLGAAISLTGGVVDLGTSNKCFGPGFPP